MSRARSVADLGNQNVLDLNANDGTLKVGAGVTIENTGEVQFAGIVTAATVQVGAATTLHSTGLDLGSGTLTCHNITSTGVLTYEDVTSVDSIGIITARSGIDVGTGTSISSPSSNVLTLGTSGSEKLRIDISGHMGLGVTPEAWHTNTKVLRIGAGGALHSQTVNRITELTTNIYSDGSNNRYIHSDFATQYYQYLGAHVWSRAASGTAGAAFTFQESMRIDSSGRMGLGTSSPSKKLQLDYVESANHSSSNGSYEFLIWNKGSSSSYPTLSAGIQLRAGDSNAGAGSIHGIRKGPANQGDLAFATTDAAGNNVEAMRIDSSGRMGLGYDSPSTLGTGRLVIGNGTGSTETITVFSSTSGTGNIHFADGTSGQDRYRGYISYEHNSNDLAFGTNDSEAFRIDSSGRLLVGTSSNIGSALLQIQGDATSSSHGGAIYLRRGEAASSITDNESIAYMGFTDNAGGTFGVIRCDSDGAAGSGDYPGKISFLTTDDGGSSPIERMRIDSRGRHIRRYPRYHTDTTTSAFGYHAFAYLSERAPGSAGTARFYRLKSTTTMVYAGGSVPTTIRLNVSYNTYHAAGAGSGEYIICSRNGSGDTIIQADLFRKLSEHSVGGWYYSLTTGFSVELYRSTGNGELIIKVIGRTGNGGTYDGSAHIHIACESLGGAFSNNGTLEIIPLGASAPSELSTQVTAQTVSWS